MKTFIVDAAKDHRGNVGGRGKMDVSVADYNWRYELKTVGPFTCKYSFQIVARLYVIIIRM